MKREDWERAMASDTWLDGAANWDTPSGWSAGVPGSTSSWPTSSGVRPPVPMYFDDLATDMSAAVGKLITARDVEMFAAVSTDTNPVHLSLLQSK